LAGIWWSAHSSSLLLIFRSIIRSKVDYGSFLFVFASRIYRKKVNFLLSSCLRIIIGAVYSTPNACIEVDLLCPPIEIRSRWLAVKFSLKNITYCQNSTFKLFLSVFTCWRYVPKTLPTLASIFSTLTNVTSLIIMPRNWLHCYDNPFEALTISLQFIYSLFFKSSQLEIPNWTILPFPLTKSLLSLWSRIIPKHGLSSLMAQY